MFDPIRARLASSFSRNGIIAVATETNCLGDISMYSTSLTGTTNTSSLALTVTLSSMKYPFSSIGSSDLAITYKSSSSAVIYTISFVALLFLGSILLYGVSIKPYSLTLAKVAKEFIRPILGPSGVSIGHILP